MPTFETRRHVPYTPAQMYDLVADVARYPEFLPLVEGLAVLGRDVDAGGRTVLHCEMRVGYGMLHERFTTRVTLDPAHRIVHARGNDGPFHKIENRWQLLRASGGANVDFMIDYDFRNPMLGLLIGSMFDSAFRKFTAAFEDRARAIYGPPVA